MNGKKRKIGTGKSGKSSASIDSHLDADGVSGDYPTTHEDGDGKKIDPYEDEQSGVVIRSR